MRRRVREQWAAYERGILPPDCSHVQRQETRRAFYAGAMSIMDALAAGMSAGDDETPEDEQVLVDLAAEREEYLADLLAGRA